MDHPRIKNITVFSDASFCQNTKAAGGAYWARGEKSRASGAFSFEGARQAHDAEIITACMAIGHLARDPVIGLDLRKGPLTRLILVVDCLTIEHVLAAGGSCRLSPAARKAVKKTKLLIAALKFHLKINHVKAHESKGTPRQWVNDWCDNTARRSMRTLRRGIQVRNAAARRNAALPEKTA